MTTLPKCNSAALRRMEREPSAAQIDQFVQDGFVKIDNAFPRELADEARAILWRDTGCDPDDPTTWTKPVIRPGMYTQESFVKAANTPVLNTAFDQLVGQRRWQPCMAMGTFPIRFPSSDDPAMPTRMPIPPGRSLRRAMRA